MGKYDTTCDMWSMGVMLYLLMSGYLPFEERNQSKLFNKIKYGLYNFERPEFFKTSDEVRDLITKLLNVDRD